jgi:hypothetical protein
MKAMKTPAIAPMAVPAGARIAPAKSGRGHAAPVQKPHNPDNHVSRMPLANGGKVTGYANGGMVKGKKGC